MNAVAMESANRAYIQQTLNRLKEIATGQAPELSEVEGSMDSVPSKPKKKPVKKTSPASSLKKVKTAEKEIAGSAKAVNKPVRKTAGKRKE